MVSVGEECMSEEITRETFNHLVSLAALELEETEAEYLRRELNNQLDAIRQLEAIPLDRNMAITSHGTRFTPEISPGLRPDMSKPFKDVHALLGQSPQTEEDYFVVPDIPHKTLK